jgi:mycothiol synthase
VGVLDVTVVRQMDTGTAARIEALRSAVESHDGFDPLGEHKRMGLARLIAHPERVDDRVVCVVAMQEGDTTPAGYAQLDIDAGSAVIELMVAPSRRRPDQQVDHALLGAALKAARSPVPNDIGADRSEAPRTIRYWAHHAGPDSDRLADAHGLHPERDLIQMRRALPVDEAGRPIKVRGFVPGRDERAWLDVNNRAFAAHPEQGGWDLETLLDREREPWFDPEGIRLHEQGGRLAGSCWTKVHATTSPPMGEIYVISVDPDFRGRGLGRALTRAGLDWLAAVGMKVGMLYVDGGNRAAVTLYRSMGFTDDHVDRSYTD